jgi:3-isopropylmalate dehydrogenase
VFDADLVEKAVTKALEDGLRTADIMQPGKTLISTEQMGTEICNRLNQLAV